MTEERNISDMDACWHLTTTIMAFWQRGAGQRGCSSMGGSTLQTFLPLFSPLWSPPSKEGRSLPVCAPSQRTALNLPIRSWKERNQLMWFALHKPLYWANSRGAVKHHSWQQVPSVWYASYQNKLTFSHERKSWLWGFNASRICRVSASVQQISRAYPDTQKFSTAKRTAFSGCASRVQHCPWLFAQPAEGGEEEGGRNGGRQQEKL